MLQKFFKYIFQSMAGMLGISVYILADTYFISVYSGADGLAVLNLILPVYGLIYAIGAMIGIGSATRYAIDRAQGKSASFYFLSSVTWDILISIPLVLAGIFIPDKILHLLGADAGLTVLGKQYLRIILAASPFFMSNYAFTAFARNDSAPAIAMLGSIAGSMFNIVFDYVFMFPAGLGLTGAALATAFCPLVTMIICSTHYLGKHNQVGFHFRAPSLRHLIACCQLGVSAFVGEISSAVIAIVFNFLLLGLAGNVGVAAYGVTANLSVVAMCLFNGLAQGTQPLISESYGKGDHTQSRQFLTWGVIACLIVEALILVLTWSMTDPLIQIFNQEQNAELRPQWAPAVFPGLSLCWHQHPAGCLFFRRRAAKTSHRRFSAARGRRYHPLRCHTGAPVWAERRLVVFPGIGNDHFLRYFAAGKAGTFFQRIT